MTTIDPSTFRGWAYGVARELLASAPGCRWEVDDLAQEGLITIWQTAPRWANDGRATQATFVTKCARRRMSELVFRGRPALGEADPFRATGSRDPKVRTASVEREVELVAQGARPMPEELTEQPTELETHEVVARVRAAVAELPEKERLAVAACDLIGLSSSQASPYVGVAGSHVRTLRRQGHARLRETLAPLAEAVAA